MLTAMLLALAGVLGAPAALADVDDFTFEGWETDVTVSRDDEGYARADITEHSIPVFPMFDQNKGLTRSIPIRYDRADTQARVTSVTTPGGDPVPSEVSRKGGNLVLDIGDDSYVHGRQEYVVAYEMRHVITAGVNVDEFVWDVLPDDRAQAIGTFRATITFDETLSSSLTGRAPCIVGDSASDTACEITEPLPAPSR